MTSPAELDRLAKVAMEAYLADSPVTEGAVMSPWRAAVSAVLEAQGPLSLASLINLHGAAAVYGFLKDEIAVSRVYGPWTEEESPVLNLGDWHVRRSAINDRDAAYAFAHFQGCEWRYRIGARLYPDKFFTREAAQSACDAALRAAGRCWYE